MNINKKNKIIFITVDGLIIDSNKILLIKRAKEPYKGFYALPGGFLNYGETTEEAIVREIKEETDLNIKPEKVINVYSNINRDPRGHIVSICYLCKFLSGRLKIKEEIEGAEWFSLGKLPSPLAFDHQKMIEDYKKNNNKIY